MQKLGKTLALASLCGLLFVGTGMDCANGMNSMNPGNTGGMGNMGGNNTGGGGAIDAILTLIRVHVQGRLAVGDDIIVYTGADANGGQTEVNYIVPSAGDTAGRGIPNAGDYDPNSFAVSGRKIILMGGPEGGLAVSVFNTSDGSLVNIPRADIFLSSIPVSNYGPGFLDVDGTHIATITQSGFAGATGPEHIRLIDVSADTPTITKFAVNPDNDNVLLPDQIQVDAETHTIVASRTATNKVWVYDILNPGLAPTAYDFANFAPVLRTFDTPFAYDNGMLLFIGVEGGTDDLAYYLNVQDTNSTPVKINTERGATRPVLRGDRYGFLNNSDSAATGVLPSSDPAAGDGDGTTIAYGVLGATPIWIVGGQDNIVGGGGDPLLYTTNGVNWMNVSDPSNAGEHLSASDVTTNRAGQYLGFKYEISDDQYLGYAILN